ncbi:A disintegrin and metalloproteinase with thrombospondin motifs 7-like, partial [Pollicipes pollicipes]|uniref:A disintegrin and metalloproteinase with thrombospondin motifs 7-like n=1 Tax=Pollicipes pollicipes TaxID=41117 RepID=UPI001884A062
QLAHGEEVVLDLRPNRRLLAPGFVVERRASAGRPGSVRRPRRHCLLQGRLRGRPHSRAALSTCRGLLGYIHTGQHQYIVEPVKGHQRAGGRPAPHLVYRPPTMDHSGVARASGRPPHPSGGPPPLPALSGRARTRRPRDDPLRGRSWGRVRRSDARSRRRPRSVSAERNVETLIVADPDVVQFYADDDIETYLLTIMNGVAQLYHDASIGNAINVILVRILILESIENTTLHFNISENADSSLKSFCSWQIKMNPSNESHPNHHDVAVLLTRRNICGENETCSTLGLAEVSGMCQPTRSCNINQDTGLAVSYTIAHELGHNFGMNHDGPGNGCDQPDGHQQHVMAPNLVNDVTPVVWSKCSRREITKFLDRDWGHCLDDQPTDHEYSYPQVPPGALYNADHQCKLLYGPAASHCDMGNVCETLWCRVQGRCVTELEPAAEGTRCTPLDGGPLANISTWCSAGDCVEMRSRPRAVDGRWGDWGAWGACSRSCGTGVQSSVRHCDQPVPANGGKYCVGERRRYRTCSAEACPEEGVTFRAQQCAAFDSVPYQGQNYTWTPVYDHAVPCQLTCRPTERHFTAVLSDTVADGTPCRLGTHDICINGKCMGIGCDGVLASEARADRCGMCHGNGSLCNTVRDTFTAKGDGYVVVAGVPAGARNIKVEEEAGAEDGSFLAVTGTKDDSDYLNANWFVQWSGEYRAGGTLLFYFREDQNETIFIPGPLKEPIVLKALLQDSSTRVRFEYTVPGHEGAEAAQVFSWRYQEWSECSVHCGGGRQTSDAVCMEDEAGRVEDIYCSTDRPETRSRPCNTEDCPARWWTQPWQPCLARCGEPGRRHRLVVCVRLSGADEMQALGEHECADQPRPALDEPCSGPTDNCEWRTGPWNKPMERSATVLATSGPSIDPWPVDAAQLLSLVTELLLAEDAFGLDVAQVPSISQQMARLAL